MSNGPTPPSALRTVTGASRRRAPRLDSDRIDRYFVLERLGQGGMGVVLAAYDPELDRRVAIKLLQSPKDSRGQLRLLREAQAMARLSHPNVVQVYDVGTSGDQVYLAMELVVGQTVRAWLREQPRGWRQIVDVFVAAGRGLVAAHDQGVVHRDFKPDNVLIAKDGRVRVADFGIASYDALMDPPPSPKPGAASYLAKPITLTGSVVGTPRYMAPEQHAGLPVGPAADQFSFCVALHEALFGERPFAGETLPELAENVTQERYRAPADPTLAPRWVHDAVRQGLRADPEERHASITALLDRLGDDPSARRRRRLRVGMLGLAMSTAIAAAAWGWTAAERACSSGDDMMASVWNDDARMRFADDPTVAHVLDDYAAGWIAAQEEMCLAHRDGTVSDDLLDTSMACLDRRRSSLQHLLEIEHAPMGGIAVAAAKLPRVMDCRDREVLALDVPRIEDEARATEVDAIRNRLAHAKVSHDAGEVVRAVADLGEIAAATEAIAYDPLTADVSLITGRLAMERADWPTARAELQRASARGIASGMDLLAAEAEARLVFVDAMASKEPLSALAREPWAASLTERVGDPGWLRALLANNIGAAHGMAGDRDRAVEYFAEAFTLAERRGDVDPLDHSGYALNLAKLTREADRRDELFARAEALVEQTLGPDHIERLDRAMARAQHMDDPQQALQHLEPVCREVAAREGDDPLRCHLCSWREAELHDELGDAAHALAAVRSALACVEKAPPSPMADALLAKGAAYAALLDEQPTAALAHLDAVARLLEPERALPWIALELADVALLRARALDRLGRGAEAAPALVDAIATYDAQIATFEDRAPHFRRARARALLRAAP